MTCYPFQRNKPKSEIKIVVIEERDSRFTIWHNGKIRQLSTTKDLEEIFEEARRVFGKPKEVRIPLS